MKTILSVLLIITIISLPVIILARDSFGQNEKANIANKIDEYVDILDNYIESSNQLILAKIENAEKNKASENVTELQNFNVNLEICKDFQGTAEIYSIYLSWLADLYRLGKDDSSSEKVKLKDKIVADLQFETEDYIPNFLDDITDPDIMSLVKQLEETLTNIKDYIKSI